MAGREGPRPRKSVLGWSVLIGPVSLGLVGAVAPQPPDLTAVSGAVYGFLLGAVVGVFADAGARSKG